MTDLEELWLVAPEQRAWRSFIRLASLLMGRLDAELIERHSLTLAEYEVLAHLSTAEGQSMRMSALAELCLVSRSGLTRRLDSLVARQFVAKETCASDRRGTIARLTALGMSRLEEAAPTHVAGVRRYLISAFTEADLDRFTQYLSAPIGLLELANESLPSCSLPASECP